MTFGELRSAVSRTNDDMDVTIVGPDGTHYNILSVEISADNEGQSVVALTYNP